MQTASIQLDVTGRWTGQWHGNNGHTGSLSCVIYQSEPRKRTAHFTAECGTSHEYSVKLDGKPDGSDDGTVLFGGNVDLGKDGVFAWSGKATQSEFTGIYEGGGGAGTFSMTREPASLTADQRSFYADQGYLILRRFFSKTVIAEAEQEAHGLLRRTELIDVRNLRCRWQPHHENSSDCLFETFDPVIDLGPVCGRLATDATLLNAIDELYGERAFLFKDKLIFKPPGAKGYGLHQDYIAWPSFPRSFLTVLIPIDPCTANNGCTVVYTGYHQQGCLSKEDGDYHELSMDSMDPARAVKMELEPGDVAIFGGFTPHYSDPNKSDHWRRQLYVSYNAASDGGDQREKHYEEFLVWLRKKYAEYGKTDVYFR